MQRLQSKKYLFHKSKAMEVKSIKNLLKQYISSKIPQKQTNIFWQMFNGIEAMFSMLEYKLNISKRERNILTATYMSSLRNLAAANGFEPTLKIPASGIATIKVAPKLYQRAGYPLYLPAYATFTEQNTGLSYYYNANKVLRLTNDVAYIPLVEGSIETVTFTADRNGINRFYLENENIADGSVTISVDNVSFQEVKSFYDSENVNDNNQFMVKFSSQPQKPILLYVKNLKVGDIVTVSYRICSGELGNLAGKCYFETEDIIDSMGVSIEADADEIEIASLSGFSFGSNGTDANALKAAIGYNHGSVLLFDVASYRDFIGKFSNILLQDVKLESNSKTINSIYISKKQTVNLDQDIKFQYQTIVRNAGYKFSDAELKQLSSLIEGYEYSLTSHNLRHSNVNSFAIQLMMSNQQDVYQHREALEQLLYAEFAKFFYDRYYVLNLELLLTDFMTAHNTKFEYIVFSQKVEEEKILKKASVSTPYIIKHDDYLPILNSNFSIADMEYQPLQLFFDINIVAKI